MSQKVIIMRTNVLKKGWQTKMKYIPLLETRSVFLSLFLSRRGKRRNPENRPFKKARDPYKRPFKKDRDP